MNLDLEYNLHYPHKQDDEVLEYNLEWMAFKQNFFSALVSTPDGFNIAGPNR